MWLSFGDSSYILVVSVNTNGQSEISGGITSAEDGSSLTTGPTAGPWTGYSDTSVNVVVDSGASGQLFDDTIILKVRDRLKDYKVLDVPRKLSTAKWGGGEW